MAKHDFKSEHDLCNYFIAAATQQGWRVFPETCGYDMLLVAGDDVKTLNAHPGDQIGVEAKIAENLKVLHQAMPKPWGLRGPNFHAALVPLASKEFRELASRLRIMVFEVCRHPWSRRQALTRHAPIIHLLSEYRMYYDSALKHPVVEVLTPAGVPSPRRVTPWKIGAVRLAIAMRDKGYGTSQDFHVANISMGRWVASKWIVATQEKIGRLTRYRIGDVSPLTLWPEIVEALSREDSKQ